MTPFVYPNFESMVNRIMITNVIFIIITFDLNFHEKIFQRPFKTFVAERKKELVGNSILKMA